MARADLSALGRTLIIVNPTAQNGAAAKAADRLQRFLTLYCHRDAFDVAQTEHPRHATKIAAQAYGYDTVLALGGDGVVHEIANGLMQIKTGKRPTLGVVPVGSGNDFARTLGLTDIDGIRDGNFYTVLGGEPATIDLMRIDWENRDTDPHMGDEDAKDDIDDRLGLRSCADTALARQQQGSLFAVQTFSMGLDAAIALGTHDLRKKISLTGMPLYMASAMNAFGRDYRCFDSIAAFDGDGPKRLRTITIAVQNGPTYGSGFQICPDADPSDGLLDICYAAGPAPRAIALPVFLSAKNGSHVGNKHIRIQRARKVSLAFAHEGYPIQVDGERLDATSVTIQVAPAALKILKPARTKS